MPPSVAAYNGGIVINAEMRRLLNQSDPISEAKGGQRLRTLYQEQDSVDFDHRALSPLGQACFMGSLRDVQQLVEGQGYDCTAKEGGFQFGYISITVAGSQRLAPAPGNPNRLPHDDVLRYLIARGAPVNSQDIVGYSALHHLCSASVQRADIARVLLQGGADPNLRNRYLEVPMFGTLMMNLTEVLDVLLEFGADLDAADVDGTTPRGLYLSCGPQVTAVVAKWNRKRSGEADSKRQEKCCDQCGTRGVSLKSCSRCKVARYCTPECQKKHWRVHKTVCEPWDSTNTVELRVTYRQDIHTNLQPAHLARWASGYEPEMSTARSQKVSQHPKKISEKPKDLIIKVQCPIKSIDASGTPILQENGTLMIYTKKRDLACCVDRRDCPQGYDAVTKVIKKKGVGKAYFLCEMQSKEVLLVKINEVLAEQPF